MKLILLFLFLFCSFAYGAGFEKVTMWSAKWSALASAATASVEGSESLLFNPAGLIKACQGDASFNFSPGFSLFKGPAVTDNKELDGKRVFVPVMGVTSNYLLSDKLAVGLGVYVSGGTKAKFEGLDFSSVNANYSTLRPTQESSLSVIETGLGAAYKLNNNWNVGATWRITMVRADLSSAKAVTNGGAAVALINVHLKDLEDENFTAFRLGTQFLSDSKNWGLGLAYRSNIEFKAQGKSSGQLQRGDSYGGTAGQTGVLNGGGDVTVEGHFPQQISLGAFSKLAQKTTLFYEVSWTEYSKLKKLKINGTALTLPLIGSNVIQDIEQNWKDQWNFKLGLQYQLLVWQLRGGYALTTQVTPDDYARVTFSSPGLGHSFILGAGRPWFNGKLITDFATEYSMASGDGVSSDGISGKYSTEIMVAHLSCKYVF